MTPYFDDGTCAIYHGAAQDVLPDIASGSVHCVVTSPPYWGRLRDYGVELMIWGGETKCKHEWDNALGVAFCQKCSAWRGCLGLEPTPELYCRHLVAIFREVRRVLRDDGTLWLNIGFSYDGKGNLIDQPGLLKDALVHDGWYCKCPIVWSKPNPLPGSQTQRPTIAHEMVWLLAKDSGTDYFYDADAIREPFADARMGRDGGRRKSERNCGGRTDGFTKPSGIDPSANGGRNRRSVWTIATQPFPEAHFATYPEALVEPCIKAGTSERGCCSACGTPWERQRELVGRIRVREGSDTSGAAATDAAQGVHGSNSIFEHGEKNVYKTVGWRPVCACGSAPIPCLILDPFHGAGTTAVVALKQGCRYIGIEPSEKYIQISLRRLAPQIVKLWDGSQPPHAEEVEELEVRP